MTVASITDNKPPKSTAVVKRVKFAEDTICTPKLKQLEKEKINSEAIGEGAILKSGETNGNNPNAKNINNIFKATDFEQALLAHYKSSNNNNIQSPPEKKKKNSKIS